MLGSGRSFWKRFESFSYCDLKVYGNLILFSVESLNFYELIRNELVCIIMEPTTSMIQGHLEIGGVDTIEYT